MQLKNIGRLAPGIMVMQFCTIFFPIYEAYKSQAQLRNSLHTIKTLNQKSSGTSSSEASFSDHGSTVTAVTDTQKSMMSTSSIEKGKLRITTTPTSSASSGSIDRKQDIYSRAALENTLSTNPTALLQFATQKDFTGENIVFLLWVSQWRAWWDQAVKDVNGLISPQAKRQLFRAAVEIYFTSVHMKTAVFPINIEGRVRSRLDNIFRGALWSSGYTDNYSHEAYNFGTHASTAARTDEGLPFIEHPGDMQQSPSFTSSLKTLVKDSSAETVSQSDAPGAFNLEMQSGNPDSDVPIPDGFNAQIFNDAEKEVKYMVLTNTWARFVTSAELRGDVRIGIQSV
jgi:hypothetical protein